VQNILLSTKYQYIKLVSTSQAQARGKERALGGDFGCSFCRNVQSDQSVWNTGTLHCRVQLSASVQFKTRHDTHHRTCMHWHHDVHKQWIGLCIMHCRVGKKRLLENLDSLASCLHRVTSVHWPGRHGRAKSSLHSCHCNRGCVHGSLHAHAATGTIFTWPA
jgi:hypothetical protein